MVLRSHPVRRAISRMVIPLPFNAWMSTSSLRINIKERAFLKNSCVVRDHQFRGKATLRGESTRGGDFRRAEVGRFDERDQHGLILTAEMEYYRLPKLHMPTTTNCQVLTASTVGAAAGARRVVPDTSAWSLRNVRQVEVFGGIKGMIMCRPRAGAVNRRDRIKDRAIRSAIVSREESADRHPRSGHGSWRSSLIHCREPCLDSSDGLGGDVQGDWQSPKGRPRPALGVQYVQFLYASANGPDEPFPPNNS